MKVIPITTLLSALTLLTACLPDSDSMPDNARFINPMIGAVTYGEDTVDVHGFGKTFPGAAIPFGLVQLSPDTITADDNGCGYSWNHDTIEGFSFLHLSGVGWYGEFGNFLVTPTTGPLHTEKGSPDNPENGYRSRFSHEQETAEAGYYQVQLLDYDVRAEATVAPRSGILRFTFPENKESRIQIDLARRIGGSATEQFVRIEDEQTLSGWMRCSAETGGWGNGEGNANYTVYFWCQLSKPLDDYGFWSADFPDGWIRKRDEVNLPAHRERVANAGIIHGQRELGGKHIGFFTEFPTVEGEQVLLKTGISFVSVEGARENLEMDIPGWDFDNVKAQARKHWNEALQSVQVSGNSEEDKTKFYTALYHTMIDPRSYADSNGKFIGADNKVHQSEKFTYRTVFSGWDVFRSQFPLQTIINPRMVNDEINTLLHMAETSGRGYLPRWEIVNSYSGCMLGNPAVSVIVDAYTKGIREYDIGKAFTACVNSVEKFGNGELGYVEDMISETLEYAYAEWCVGTFALALDKPELAQKYFDRGQSYRNIWNSEVDWFRGRNAAGNWREWEGLTVHDDWESQGCIESNPLQQAWFVPHDLDGLISLMGSRERFTNTLIDFFENTPEDFTWNDYYNHANEPVHHVPFLFNEVGRPDLTQKWTRKICSNAYGTGPFGLCGNEDVGQMSAWYALAAMGIYPICPGDTRYQVTSPVFNRITIQLDEHFYGGNTFSIIADNNSPENIYIQSMMLNGKPLDRYWIRHDEITSGGTLELVMGPEPLLATEDFKPFGHPEIDAVRRELPEVPTNADNFDVRKNTLYLWSRFLMFYGADLTNLDPQEHKDHYDVVQPRYPKPGTITNMNYSERYAQEIDYQFSVLEKIFMQFSKNPDQRLVPLERDSPTTQPAVEDWPSMRGDEGNTGFTTQTGPLKGELLWKFPAGHSWYARPAFEDGKVYIGSPGISYESYCIDAETGDYIWKSIPQTGWNPYWKNYSSRSCSPTLITDKHIIIRKMQVASEHGAPDEHLVYIDKRTGKRDGGIDNPGFLTSCVGYVPFSGNNDYVVYPDGLQSAPENHKGLGNDYQFEVLKCNDVKTKEILWEYPMGMFFAEPLLDNGQVFCGNYDGEMHCIDVKTGKTIWKVTTPRAINCAPAVDEKYVYFGSEDGAMYALNREDGSQIWSFYWDVEPNAFQTFSTVVPMGELVLVGSADKKLYAVDSERGWIRWRIELDDWIRSAPVFKGNTAYAATLSGTVYSINFENNKPTINWSTKVSEHGIYADLTTYRGDVYAASSDFMLTKLSAVDGDILWSTSTFESIKDEQGNRVLGDLVGQPDYQSSAIVVDGIAYFGSPRFIYAVDVASGKEVWRFETRGQVTGAPAYANGRIFIGQRGGTPFFYCLDAKTGELMWRQKFGWVWASAHCRDDKVYICSENGTFWCVDQKYGSVIWKYVTEKYAYPEPSFDKDLVYFGSGHDYYAFDADTGNLVWRFDMGQGRSDSGTSLVKDDMIYIQGAASTDFFALNALTGKEIWRHTLKECNVSPASDGKHLIFCNWEGLLIRSPGNAYTYCIDAKTGEEIYTLNFAALSGPVICNDLVFSASSTDPYFKAWDVATGEILWRYKMGGRAEESCTTIYGDKAFVVASDGYLYAFH